MERKSGYLRLWNSFVLLFPVLEIFIFLDSRSFRDSMVDRIGSVTVSSLTRGLFLRKEDFTNVWTLPPTIIHLSQYPKDRRH